MDDWPEVIVVGEATHCTDAAAAGEQADIVLFDCDVCPVGCFNHAPCTDDDGDSFSGHDDCLTPLRQLFSAGKGVRVLLLADGHNLGLYRQALRIGVMGLILKNESVEVLLKAIKKVHGGELWLNQLMVINILNHLHAATGAKGTDPEAARIATLTGREFEVVALIREGLKNKQIAERLFISQATVHHHLTAIYDKLGVTGRSQLMIYAYQHRLTHPHPARFHPRD